MAEGVVGTLPSGAGLSLCRHCLGKRHTEITCGHSMAAFVVIISKEKHFAESPAPGRRGMGELSFL